MSGSVHLRLKVLHDGINMLTLYSLGRELLHPCSKGMGWFPLLSGDFVGNVGLEGLVRLKLPPGVTPVRQRGRPVPIRTAAQRDKGSPASQLGICVGERVWSGFKWL